MDSMLHLTLDWVVSDMFISTSMDWDDSTRLSQVMRSESGQVRVFWCIRRGSLFGVFWLNMSETESNPRISNRLTWPIMA